jgi:two-component system, chemotaxis family, sensor kinase CheA
MAIDADEEILQDFLIEAGELLESLSEQLVELENAPDDRDLLNAIFRGFHTVKGGAGFLNLTPLVDICHLSENIFDMLRNGKKVVNAELMDVILKALDSINDMFDVVRSLEMPDPPDPELLQQLELLNHPDGEAPAAEVYVAEPEPELAQAPAASDGNVITDDEFEALLDELNGAPGSSEPSKSEPAAAATASSTDANEISDDEFEALLDELHGSGGSPTEEHQSTASATPPQSSIASSQSNSASNDAISDDEFDALLDELHGSGKAPGIVASAASTAQPSKPEPSKPAPVAKPAPAPKPIPKPAAPVKAAPSAPAKAAPPKKAGTTTAMQPEATVRVDTKRLDDIMNMVGELVLVRNRLVTLGLNHQDEHLAKAVQNLDVVTGDLQGAVMKTRMQPIKKVFGRFPRVVRDLARSLKKEIVLELVGEDTDLDKNLVEALADPLVHLVRNSVDHGVEMPDDRELIGKPRVGKVILSASQEGDHILLSIKDDGKGIDNTIIRAKAVEKGIMDKDAADRLSENEAFNLIFHAGFSTKAEISDISGRGVGMDVVKTKIAQLNGSIDVHSELGEGTEISIKVPLTLAILPTLMVVVSKQIFALPLASVSEIFHLDLTRTNVVDNQLTIIVREKAIPLFYLTHWLIKGANRYDTKNEGHVVIVQIGTQRIGFVVDSLIGQEEVVIKPLGTMLQGTAGMAGATITSDGSIALILDVPGLLNKYA